MLFYEIGKVQSKGEIMHKSWQEITLEKASEIKNVDFAEPKENFKSGDKILGILSENLRKLCALLQLEAEKGRKFTEEIPDFFQEDCIVFCGRIECKHKEDCQKRMTDIKSVKENFELLRQFFWDSVKTSFNVRDGKVDICNGWLVTHSN